MSTLELNVLGIETIELGTCRGGVRTARSASSFKLGFPCSEYSFRDPMVKRGEGVGFHTASASTAQLLYAMRIVFSFNSFDTHLWCIRYVPVSVLSEMRS